MNYEEMLIYWRSAKQLENHKKFLGNLSSLSFVAKSEDDVLNIVANAGRAETVCCLISYMKIVKLTKHTSSGSYLSFISY